MNKETDSKSYLFEMCVILTITFMCFKFAGIGNWEWVIVFLPIIIWLALLIAGYALAFIVGLIMMCFDKSKK